MKKIITLSAAFLVTMASFASYAPSRLTVEATGKNNTRVTVDETTFDKQVGENGTVFENLAPGFHTVRFYQSGRLVYSAAVQIKPMYELSIVLNNQGKAVIDEQPLDSDDARSMQYNDDAGYSPVINYGDFVGLKRMMMAERFDQDRLDIAKKAVDNSTMSSVQVKEMAQLFTSENAKLDFAKYAYGKTVDKNNYMIVCNVFPFGDNKADLTNYMRNYK
ncbi:MAG TPA: DUF4476 domain-containing protein [Chitinophagaceae bacterium]